MNNRDKIHEVADEVNGRVTDNYSGRGMFGDICFGIVCEDANECLEVFDHSLATKKTWGKIVKDKLTILGMFELAEAGFGFVGVVADGKYEEGSFYTN